MCPSTPMNEMILNNLVKTVISIPFFSAKSCKTFVPYNERELDAEMQEEVRDGVSDSGNCTWFSS